MQKAAVTAALFDGGEWGSARGKILGCAQNDKGMSVRGKARGCGEESVSGFGRGR